MDPQERTAHSYNHALMGKGCTPQKDREQMRSHCDARTVGGRVPGKGRRKGFTKNRERNAQQANPLWIRCSGLVGALNNVTCAGCMHDGKQSHEVFLHFVTGGRQRALQEPSGLEQDECINHQERLRDLAR